jgi:hypothetical protein
MMAKEECMSIKVKTAALTAGIALVAVPAYGAGQQPTTTPPGYDSTTNPGTTYQPTTTPPGYDGTTNPGTTQVQTNAGNTSEPTNPHALAVQQCASFKTNFKTNKSAFGKCVSAVELTLKGSGTPAQECRSKRLSKTKHDSQARSDYRACVLAATKALHVSG